MRGEVKTILEFLELIGHVDSSDYGNHKRMYSVKLIPDQSEIPLMMLNRLAESCGMDVKIWFYEDSDDNKNACRIELVEK